MVTNPAHGQLNREIELFPCCLHSRLKAWSRELGSAVPSRVSLLILHTKSQYNSSISVHYCIVKLDSFPPGWRRVGAGWQRRCKTSHQNLDKEYEVGWRRVATTL